MNHWDRARVLSLPGVKVDAYIDPAALPVRIKRSVQRMIKSGTIKGGWSSKSRHLAELINGHFPIGLVKYSSSYLTVGALPRALRDELLDIHTAAKAAWLLENRNNRWSTQYFADGEAILKSDTGVGQVYLYLADFVNQATEVIADHPSPWEEERQRAIARLDSTEIIPLQLNN